ncbi:MAG: hypothetical protein KIS63_02945 [Caldilineales bacterium]|nr:hypothetical protein [Caldilineales bacterium]
MAASATIRFLMRFVQTRSLYLFAVYVETFGLCHCCGRSCKIGVPAFSPSCSSSPSRPAAAGIADANTKPLGQAAP